MGYIIRILGTIVGFIIALPLPWKARVLFARLLQISLSILLAHVPKIYDFVIGENRRHNMGKQNKGEMQSIMAMECVLREIEVRHIEAEYLKCILERAEIQNISETEFGVFIGENVLGIQDTNKLIDKIIAF